MNFLGIDDVNIFFGVVEDRNDPKKLGRVRVRIYGLHDENLVPSDKTGRGIPTEELPWAYPVQDINSASMNGIGTAPIGPVEGTNVIGFARDEAFQDLIIFGTIGGIPQEEANTNRGFNDPNGNYPKSDFVGEPDTNRLARNENIDQTIVQDKKNNVDSEIGEPETPFDAEYPKNQVRESESGHIEEYDDTEGAERTHWYHTKGTFKEIHPDGTVVYKIVSDNYEIVAGDNNVHVKGKDTTIYDGDKDKQVKGKETETYDSDLEVNISGNATINVSGDAEVVATGSLNLESSTQIELVAPQIIKRS